MRQFLFFVFDFIFIIFILALTINQMFGYDDLQLKLMLDYYWIYFWILCFWVFSIFFFFIIYFPLPFIIFSNPIISANAVGIWSMHYLFLIYLISCTYIFEANNKRHTVKTIILNEPEIQISHISAQWMRNLSYFSTNTGWTFSFGNQV